MGVWSDKDTLPFTGFKTRLANFTKLDIPGSPVAAAWPANSPKQMGEAWDAIRGMLHGHPDMRDWQDPKLVGVGEEQGMKGKAMDVDGEEMGNEVKRKAGMEGTEEKVSEGDKDEDGHRGKRRKVVLKE
jgi:hypothetical protein